jgi:hypothetical protein
MNLQWFNLNFIIFFDSGRDKIQMASWIMAFCFSLESINFSEIREEGPGLS